MRPLHGVAQGHEALEELVHDHAEAEDVAFEAVELVPEHLGGHVLVRACLARHQELRVEGGGVQGTQFCGVRS